MPSDAFKIALDLILELEGGYVNNALDPGGATNKGITQKIYDLYRIKKRRPRQFVKNIDNSEVSEIYAMWYWQPIHGDALPPCVAIPVFDGAVHMGPRRSVRFLLESVGIPIPGTQPDGSEVPLSEYISEDVLYEVGIDPFSTASAYLKIRRAYLRSLVDKRPSSRIFLRGWMNRIDRVTDVVEDLYNKSHGQ